MHYCVASVGRIDKITGLFCKRALQKRHFPAKETFNFIDPADRSHPMWASRTKTISICMYIYTWPIATWSLLAIGRKRPIHMWAETNTHLKRDQYTCEKRPPAKRASRTNTSQCFTSIVCICKSSIACTHEFHTCAVCVSFHMCIGLFSHVYWSLSAIGLFSHKYWSLSTCVLISFGYTFLLRGLHSHTSWSFFHVCLSLLTCRIAHAHDALCRAYT